MPRRVIRKLRHWKQRFDPNVDFIWRRRTTFGDETYEPGDPIPKMLHEMKAKLRRFWESHWIELAEFEEKDVATGQVDLLRDVPPGVTVVKAGGNWFAVTTSDGETTKVNGWRRLQELLNELRGSDG